MMKRVTGIGGIFFKSRDPEGTAAWYREHLGVPVGEHGYCDFEWRHPDAPERVGRTVWSLFRADTDYFGPGDIPFMVNYRVEDLDALLAALREEGVEVADEVEEYDYGRFGWITDPEGRRIELWEPGDESVLASGEEADEPSSSASERSSADDAVRATVLVTGSADRAFSVFTERIESWWPSAYTWSGDARETIAIEAGVGGRCFERGPEGFECDWGRVVEWAPPERLAFTWQISPSRVPVPDPARASEVEVTFRPEEDGIRVRLEHRHFDRHGEGADDYRRAMGSDRGWPLILDGFAHVCAGWSSR